MKQFLLLFIITVLGCMTATADSAVMDNVAIKQISPDGKYLVSDNDGGVVKIFDASTLKEIYTVGDGGWSYFFLGYGNALSSTGMMVGDYISDPALIDIVNKTVTILPYDSNLGYGGVAQAITPDASVISGVLYYNEGTPTNIPVIWEREKDGSYSTAKQLPYPEKDWLGNTPYRIETYSISNDGTTIAAQAYDTYMNTGKSILWPFVLKKDSEGNWSCRYVCQELLNPNKIEMPERPERVYEPNPYSYMNADEKAAYAAALDRYYDNIDPIYPEAINFLNGESLENYIEALNKYDDYISKQALYDAAYDQVWEDSPKFQWTTTLDPTGRYLAQYDSVEDLYFGSMIGKSYIFDLQENTYITTLDNVQVSQFLEDGSILGFAKVFAGTFIGYIQPIGQDEFIPLYNWVGENNQTTDEWMSSNMTHTVYDATNIVDGQPVYEPMVVSGRPCASATLSVLATFTNDAWSYEGTDLGKCYSYILDLNAQSSITEIDDSDIGPLDVYNLNGILVRKAIEYHKLTSLPTGIYIIHSCKGIFKYLAR